MLRSTAGTKTYGIFTSISAKKTLSFQPANLFMVFEITNSLKLICRLAIWLLLQGQVV